MRRHHILGQTLLVACVLLASLLSLTAQAEESVDVCYNYGCKSHAVVKISDEALQRMNRRFVHIDNAATERIAIALTVGDLASIAGQQTPVHNDKGGNGGDETSLDGKMDCFDHAATTTSYLQLMNRLGWLHFHSVSQFVERAPLIFNYHRAAHIIENASAAEFAVDNWFFDNGEPAVVIPLAQWLKGAWPEDIKSDGVYVQRDRRDAQEQLIASHDGEYNQNNP
ncbi:hypothetical protein [Leeia oryzae]|uniref:hypothetical protein n=1 Tax=Leeia oryzae TaxID=356662 RepID=UPI000382436F|nr:hypothetical protein [Leeia oryzae]